MEQGRGGDAARVATVLVGITQASPIEPSHVHRLTAWLDDGCAGPMPLMHQHLDKRIDPGQLPGTRSVIVVGLNYEPPDEGCRSDPVPRRTMTGLRSLWEPLAFSKAARALGWASRVVSNMLSHQRCPSDFTTSKLRCHEKQDLGRLIMKKLFHKRTSGAI